MAWSSLPAWWPGGLVAQNTLTHKPPTIMSTALRAEATPAIAAFQVPLEPSFREG